MPQHWDTSATGWGKAGRPASNTDNRTGPLMREFLRRVYDADCADRFTLRQVCPADATRFEAALDWLLERELVERVPVRCGVWFFRLTPAGVLAAESGEIPKPAKHAERIEPGGSLVRPTPTKRKGGAKYR